MKPVYALLLCLTAAGLVVCPNYAKSNVMPIGVQLGSAMPVSPHKSIRMTSEQVTIRLRRTSYTVDAVFHLLNAGEDTVEWVGFPVRGRDYPVIRVEAWVDGKVTELSERNDLFGKSVMFKKALPTRGPMKVRWAVQHIAFPGNAVTTLRFRYEAPYDDPFLGQSNHVTASYIYGTGCLWKGNIGAAAFIVDCTDVGGIQNVEVSGLESGPGPRLISENVVRYEIRDFEPWLGAEFTMRIRRPSLRPRLRHQ